MRNILACAAIAATFSMAGAAMAQTPPSSKPTAPTTGAPATAQPSDATPSAAPPSAAGAGANAAASASGGLMTGMSVKDKTGAIIGEVKELKGGVATVQMGSDTFSVDSNKLGVAGGAATINASQAELKQMLAGAKK